MMDYRKPQNSIQHVIFVVATLLLAFLLMPMQAQGAACDYSELDTCRQERDYWQTQYGLLNDSFSDLNYAYDLLQQNYSEVVTERDYYKESYLNSSLGNLTVRDFLNFTQYVNNYHSEMNMKIENIETKFNILDKSLKIRFTVEIALISVGLISITIVLWRISKKYLLILQEKISNIHIHEKEEHKNKKI